MAAELEVSPSYLNLMERNQRPITVQVLIRLTSVYGVDPRDFMEIEGEHSVGEMEQILADPLFRDAAVPRAEVRDAAENSPALARRHGAPLPSLFAAREASEAALPPEATATAPGPFSAKAQSTESAPSCKTRATIFRTSKMPPRLLQPSWRSRETASTSPCANICVSAMASAFERCRPRSWATGCAGTIITAAN